MGGFAWVTLATNDSYSLGALVLARSLEQVGTRQQLAVLITPGVTNAMRSKLTEVFNVVQEVNLLDSRDEENLRLLKRPELGVTFTKLHCWRLTQFDKCVFLDADTLVLENCDELFDREELSAAPDIGWPDCFNSGVFVYRPSNETFEKLIQFAIEKGSFDGGDQGLLNLYFSDWAHKDISKHLPFIYNMSSTACYSYLPAYKQFGKTAKIIHFIGATKPWLQYFDTETKKVHPSEGLKHLEEVLQRWWDLFCAIHPSLSPEMTSHTDTVHGSQSSTLQIAPHTPHHLHHQNFPSSSVPHPAEDYQNVWDPWEEYDSRQPQEQHNVQSSVPDHTFHISQNTFSEPVNETPFQVYGHVGHSHQVSHPVHTHESPSQQLSHPVHNHQTPHPVHLFENQSHSFQHHESHSPDIHTPTIHSPNIHSPIHHSPIHHSESRYQFNESQIHCNETQTRQNQFFESHNTNAVSDADHHSHNHPPSPTYSHPQPHSRHYEAPPPCPVQEIFRSTSPPPSPPDEPVPRLPDECVTTTTVSNEIILQTGSNEDTNKNAAGLAGAFAKLTLGAPRTPEQAALDDHLRRQGWEVGNIDYLGRDSFQNIWSKICETLSAAPEQPIPKPESPKVEVKTKEVPPPAEVKSVEKAQTESEDKQKSEQANADDQVVVKSRSPEALAQPPSRSPEQVTKEVEAPKESPVTPKESELPPEGTPVTSAIVTSAPSTEVPTSATPEPVTVTSETPTPVSSAPSTPVPVTPAPDTSAQTLVSSTPVPSAILTPVTSTLVSPASITLASDTLATVSPSPASSAPVTPAPVSPAPVTSAPVSSAPVTSAPVSTAPVTPAPVSSAPVTPAPVSSSPVTRAPASSAPVTPTPLTPAAEAIAPVIPDSVSSVPSAPNPVTPDVETSASITPAPVSSDTITPVPISSATIIPAEAPATSTHVPVTPDVDTAAIVTPASAGVVTTAPVSSAPVGTSVHTTAVKEADVEKLASVVKASEESGVPATKSSVGQSIEKPPKEVSAPVTTSSEVPIPLVCPVAPQSKVSEKSSGSSTTSGTVSSKELPKKISRDPKKLKEEIQAPKTHVTEPTPPTTPVSPQYKETKPALEVDPVVPDTPPVPAQESSAAPTPAPRKSNRSDKKTGTKTKK